MSMSDCEKCWDTPCTCGYDYRNWTITKLEEQVAMLNQVIAAKRDQLSAVLQERCAQVSEQCVPVARVVHAEFFEGVKAAAAAIRKAKL